MPAEKKTTKRDLFLGIEKEKSFRNVADILEPFMAAISGLNYGLSVPPLELPKAAAG